MAHDLQSPICSLRGFGRLLQREFGARLDERGRSYLDRMLASVDRMQALVQELLACDVDQPRRDDRTLVESRQICLQLAADLKPSLDERNIELILPAAPPQVYATRTQLFRVLSNLVCNSIQHMGNTRAPCILIDFRRVAGGVELIVQDNGKGIAPSEHPGMPDPAFGGGDPGTRRPGLGLSIVNQIVKDHGGSIAVESTPGRGATFRILFPDPTF